MSQADLISSSMPLQTYSLAEIKEKFGEDCTAVPDFLAEAFIDGRVSRHKFKFIAMILTHENLSYGYFRSKFHPQTIAKIEKELTEDKVIVVRKGQREGKAAARNIYDIKSISHWNLRELRG